MQIRARNLEQIFNFAVVAESHAAIIEFFPVQSMTEQPIERSSAIYLLVQPRKIDRHSEVVSGTVDHSHVVHAVPVACTSASDVIGTKVLMQDVILEPSLNQAANSRGVEQTEAQACKRSVPGSAHRRENAAPQSDVCSSVG